MKTNQQKIEKLEQRKAALLNKLSTVSDKAPKTLKAISQEIEKIRRQIEELE